MPNLQATGPHESCSPFSAFLSIRKDSQQGHIAKAILHVKILMKAKREIGTDKGLEKSRKV